jgi:hypothetical protein
MMITKEQAIKLMQLGSKHVSPPETMEMFGLDHVPDESVRLYRDGNLTIPVASEDRVLLEDKIAFVGGYDGLRKANLIKGDLEHLGLCQKGGTDDSARKPCHLICCSLDLNKLQEIAGMSFDSAQQRARDRQRGGEQAF